MPDPEKNWVIAVHGGAKSIARDLLDLNRDGCRRAAEAGAAILREGGTAVAAAEAAVRVLEDDPVFNAGHGSVLNADGNIEMDAALMDGATLDIGAVVAVSNVRNPISVAARMLREPPVLLAGLGAERFAREVGLDPVDPVSMIAPGSFASEASHDTVGCVAMDASGHFAAANSTGGLSGTLAGRVGDAALPGCGFYADDFSGAVALSGDGEAIARSIVAARVLTALCDGADAQAAAERVHAIERVGGEAGAIVVDRSGRIGMAHNSDHFAVGVATAAGPVRGVVNRAEFEELAI